MTIEEFKNLEIGDKVRVLCPEEWTVARDFGVTFVEEMEEYCGRILTVSYKATYPPDDYYIGCEENSWALDIIS